MDNKDYIRVFFYSYYTTITGWGVLLSYHSLSSSDFLALQVEVGHVFVRVLNPK